MFSSENISIYINKVQKIWSERGPRVLLRQLAYLGKSKLNMLPIEKNLKSRDAFLDHIDKGMLSSDIERIFSSGLLRSLPQINTDIRSLPSKICDKILNEAENILKNEFTIYGRLKVKVDHDHFSWLRDPLTNYVWSIQDNSKDYIYEKPTGTDIKNIWELSRFQFLSQLAYAYVITKNESYAQFAIDKVTSWIDENPFLFGPHWTRAMEASIRVLNWVVFLPFLNSSSFYNPSFIQKITKSILEHFIYIREHLEISPAHANNHYLANLVALLLSRLIFPSLPWAMETSEFAENELEREIERQFTFSGINFEGSLPYHRLSSEICLMGVALIKKSGRDVSEKILNRLTKVAQFTRYHTDTSEECPLIGDNDSGIFLKYFTGQESNRHQYVRYLIDSILDNKNIPQNWDDFLCGIHFMKTLPPNTPIQNNPKKINKDVESEIQVKNFDGLVVARHQGNAIYFNTLRAYSGHTHNDKLSIYPIIGKKPLFIDRGSFSYTGFKEKRHEDRMTASHNGPVVNGWEQNRIWKNDVFYINKDAKCYNYIEFIDGSVTLTGWHTGYERYRKGLVTYRKVKWNIKKRKILISDWVEGYGKNEIYNFMWKFLINPVWLGEIENGTLILKNADQTIRFENEDRINFTLSNDFYCPSYQLESLCQALLVHSKVVNRQKINFLLHY